jgi:hypothetical protein
MDVPNPPRPAPTRPLHFSPAPLCSQCPAHAPALSGWRIFPLRFRPSPFFAQDPATISWNSINSFLFNHFRTLVIKHPGVTDGLSLFLVPCPAAAALAQTDHPPLATKSCKINTCESVTKQRTLSCSESALTQKQGGALVSLSKIPPRLRSAHPANSSGDRSLSVSLPLYSRPGEAAIFSNLSSRFFCRPGESLLNAAKQFAIIGAPHPE